MPRTASRSSSIETFFEPLSHYGRWLDTRYGRVWSPNVPRDWRPYTIGHWEDGPYGLTWRSDEPFGWAVFHFGRWAFDPQIGWVWSPDTVWGPGWVAWRDGDDVTGWAPLPPQVSVDFAFGSSFAFNDWGYDQWYQPGWVYVPRGQVYSRSLRGIYFPFARNRDYWERTRGVTRYDRVDGQIVNHSFGGRWRGDGGGRDRLDAGRNAGDRGRDPRDVRNRDQGRDPRDFRGRDGELRGQSGVAAPYDGTPRGIVPPGATAPQGYVPQRAYERRDGFAPGSPPPRGFDRRAAPPVVPPAGTAAAAAAPCRAAAGQPHALAPRQHPADGAAGAGPRAAPRAAAAAATGTRAGQLERASALVASTTPA